MKRFLIIAIAFITLTSVVPRTGTMFPSLWPVLPKSSPKVVTTYYVSNTGSDAANGTSSATPWLTIAKVIANPPSPGDIVLFKRGDMWREELLLPSSGTAGNPITYGAYGTGAKPIINGADVTTGWTNAGSNQWWVNNPYVVTTRTMVIIGGTIFTEETSLANMTSAGEYFVDVSATPDRVYVYSTVDPATLTAELMKREACIASMSYAKRQYITIQDIECRYADGGISLIGDNTPYDGQCIVERCTLYANRLWGTTQRDYHNNNTFRHCTSSYNGNGYYSWIADGCTMQYDTCSNSIHYNIGTGYTDGGAFQNYQSDDFLCEYSISTDDQDSFHPDAGGLPINAVFRYNKAYSSKFGSPNTPTSGFGSVTTGGLVEFYYNLFVNGASAGIECYTHITGAVNIYNNTFYEDATHATDATAFIAYGANITMKNNLFIREYVTFKNTIYNGDATICTLNNNVYYHYGGGAFGNMRCTFNGTPQTTIAAWRTATGGDANSLSADPLFVDKTSDWHLQNTSPAIDAGVSVGLTHDLDGNPIVGNPDIGAYEYTVPGTPIQWRGRRGVVQ